MRLLITIFLSVQISISFSQADTLNAFDSLPPASTHYGPPMLDDYNSVFWGSYDGVFLGIENRYDLGTYALGFEVKPWAAYYGSPIINFSFYTGYRYLFDFNDIDSTLNHSIKLGFQFSFIGLETNFYFGKYEQFLWTLTPKIGWDIGHISIFYGYNLPLINRSDKSWRNFHMVQLVYAINLIE